MKPSITALLVAFILSGSSLFSQTNYYYPYQSIPSYSTAEIQERLAKIPYDAVKPQFDEVVKSYIKTYTVKKRQHTEDILGRATIYFPLFEKYLKEANMPMDLKYLPIVESALIPTATSRSKAVGLWQFMEATGKENGLSVNRNVDERRDPNKATLAAIQFLTKLHKRYNSWELALAAYNGGPGRVNKAIKRGRSNNFWKIRKYLPKETQNYVPAFISVCYVLNYYQLHNLAPNFPDPDFQTITSIKVYDPISFARIAEITGLPVSKIKEINPSYNKDIIPQSHVGNYLILPSEAMNYFASYLGRPHTIIHYYAPPEPGTAFADLDSQDIIKTSYVVQQGDQLDQLAKLFKCNVIDIKKWNNLVLADLRKGQKLLIYQPKQVLSRNTYKAVMQFLPTLKLRPFYVSPKVIESLPFADQHQQKNRIAGPSGSPKSKNNKLPSKSDNKRGKYEYYQLRRKDSLADVADLYPSVTLEDLLELNAIDVHDHPKAGTKIKIRKL